MKSTDLTASVCAAILFATAAAADTHRTDTQQSLREQWPNKHVQEDGTYYLYDRREGGEPLSDCGNGIHSQTVLTINGMAFFCPDTDGPDEAPPPSM